MPSKLLPHSQVSKMDKTKSQLENTSIPDYRKHQPHFSQVEIFFKCRKFLKIKFKKKKKKKNRLALFTYG